MCETAVAMCRCHHFFEIFTARNGCGKVMFSQVYACSPGGGVSQAPYPGGWVLVPPASSRSHVQGGVSTHPSLYNLPHLIGTYSLPLDMSHSRDTHPPNIPLLVDIFWWPPKQVVRILPEWFLVLRYSSVACLKFGQNLPAKIWSHYNFFHNGYLPYV